MLKINTAIIVFFFQLSFIHGHQLTKNATQPQPISGYKKINKRYHLKYQSNYNDLYPQAESIYLIKITPLPKKIGVQVKLGSYLPGLSYFLYKTNSEPEHKSLDGTFNVMFDSNEKFKVQFLSTKIKAVNILGDRSKTYEINIRFYPQQLYALNGRTEPGWVIIQNTNLSFPTSRIEDWIIQTPTNYEKAFAQRKWGQYIDPKKSDAEKAIALAKILIDELEPHKGIPSDLMKNISPFDQYERVIAGKDHLWCGNIAVIFCYASNSLNIPCRVVGLSRKNPLQPTEKSPYRLLLAEGHGTTEIYSKDQNQWIWIDTNFNILSAYLGNEGPLNLTEFYHYINSPSRISHLKILQYYPLLSKEKFVGILKSEKSHTIMNYFKQDQEFHYIKRNSNSAKK